MRQHRGILDGDEVDGDYKVYLSAQFEEIQEECLNMENEEEEEDDYDPQYKLFFQNLKPCGTAYVLEFARGNEKAKIVKYEDGDEDEFQSSDERKRKVRNPVSRHSPRARGSNGLLRREMKNLEIGSGQSQGQTSTRNASRKDVPGQNGKRKTGSKEKSETPNCRGSARKCPVEIESSDDLEEGKSRHKSRVGSRKRGEHLSKGEKDKGRVFKTPYHDEMDKGYYGFLRSVRISGNSVIYTDKDGNDVIYDECTDESRSDSDSDTEGLPYSGRMTPEPSSKKRPAPSDKRVPSNEEVGGSSFNFRQGVMDILLKPYDKKEHLDLWEKAVHRKPLVRHKEMRSRCADFFDDKTMGRSYLDHHGDLRKKITAVKRDDPPKALHLLRGFFFYLQYTCMEGQFKPWNDELWLEAMNRSTS